MRGSCAPSTTNLFVQAGLSHVPGVPLTLLLHGATQLNPTQPNPTQPNPTQSNPTQPNPTQPDPTLSNPTHHPSKPPKCRDRKASLGAKFRVRGIPALIILDETGAVITADGRATVNADPEGHDFPWRPKPLSELIGREFLTKRGMAGHETVRGKTIALYFSSQWWVLWRVCSGCEGVHSFFAYP